MKNEIRDAIRGFVEENFLFRGDGDPLAEDASLLAAGLIDSTGVLELVAFLEQRFGIAVADADIVPQNFDSIAGLAAFVESSLAAGASGHAAAAVAGHAG